MSTLKPVDWLEQLQATLPGYLRTLQVDERPGRFWPCVNGRTRLGSQISLGFSCFALKLYTMLGWWDQLPAADQKTWIRFIQSFQKQGVDPITHQAFIDQALIYNAYHYHRYPQQFLYHLYTYMRNPRLFVYDYLKRETLTFRQRVIVAETKQAIATLADVGAAPDQLYSGSPGSSEDVTWYLQALDWTQPWGAGAQTAMLPVFWVAQRTRRGLPLEAIKACNNFLTTIVSPETGGYYQGNVPSHGQLINGAMKVLTALDWLDTPIHYPEKLIDTCLSQLPASDGCHLVDAIYVLYRCRQQTDYRQNEIRTYCGQVMEMIKAHYNADGGFSYYIGRSQTGYYWARIARGLPESDIHGTTMLTWSLVMITEMLGANQFGWRVIKP